MAQIDVEEFSTAEAFLEALRPSNDRWWDAKANRATHFFRGHKNLHWPLLASGLRPLDERNKLTPLFDRIRERLQDGKVATTEDEVELELRTWRYALTEACHQFSEVCRRVGLPADYFEWSSILTRESLWEEVELHMPAIEPLAQHHGVPTALLDWTENPLVAGYFAAEADDVVEAPCVWALAVSKDMPHIQLSPGEGLPLKVMTRTSPTMENLNQRSQKGIFTWISNEAHWFKTMRSWPDLQSLHQRMPTGFLTKLVLPRSEVKQLRRLLYREGISRAHLMPTYDNAAKLAEDLYSQGGL